jgi:hypothetical protein
VNRPAAGAIAPVAITELSRGAPVLATGRPIMFNRIFTTERLLQIIVILAATVAMKLMS